MRIGGCLDYPVIPARVPAGGTSMNQDLEHLKLLSIFHYIVGGMGAFFACFPIMHIVIGLIFIFSPESFENPGDPPPPPWFGWLFVGMGSIFVLCGWTIAGLVVATGRFLARRTHYMFCLVIAGIECLFMPFGTILGIFTIIVLVRESVNAVFYRVKRRGHCSRNVVNLPELAFQ